MYSFASMQPKFDISIKLNKECPNVPYLMFADDSIIFGRATKRESRELRYILDHYFKVLDNY